MTAQPYDRPRDLNAIARVRARLDLCPLWIIETCDRLTDPAVLDLAKSRAAREVGVEAPGIWGRRPGSEDAERPSTYTTHDEGDRE